MDMEGKKELVKSLVQVGVLKTWSLIFAFLKIDRKDFVIEEYKRLSYIDTALPIGYEQTTSQPYTVAFMLELLGPMEGENILDIGSGSGWTTALLSHIVGKKGFVTGVEIVPELVKMGRENISKYDIKNVKIIQASKKLGIPSKKFDRILVSAAAKEFPNELLKQIKLGGVIVIPVNNSIYRVYKEGKGKIKEEKHFGFSFVPLKQ